VICPVVGVGGPFVGCDNVLTGDDDLLVIVISVVIGSSMELIYLVNRDAAICEQI